MRTIRTTLVTSLLTTVTVLGLYPLAPSEGLSQEAPTTSPSATTPEFDHSDWATVLYGCVGDGDFNYDNLINDQVLRGALDSYLATVASASLAGMSDAEKLAFWINAYNAYVVKGVLDNWPLDSVLSVEGFFDTVDYTVASRELTLNEIENEQIRPVFNEPRIHFAVNCASVGCPPISAQPYLGRTLDAQLEAQAVAYIERTTTVDENLMRIGLSKIFEWFSGDFGGVDGVREFVAQRHTAGDSIRNGRNLLVFIDYDWALNGAN